MMESSVNRFPVGTMPNPKEQINEAVYTVDKFCDKNPDHYLTEYLEVLSDAYDSAKRERDVFENLVSQVKCGGDVVLLMGKPISYWIAIDTKLKQAESENAALRSLVRRMRDSGCSLAETIHANEPCAKIFRDAWNKACAEADKAIGVDERLRSEERSER